MEYDPIIRAAAVLRVADLYAITEGHVPCPPISGCDVCMKMTVVAMQRWADADAADPTEVRGGDDPLVREARDLALFWWNQGSLAMDIRFPNITGFDEARARARLQ